MKKIIVLISGTGSNLQAIIDACAQGRIQATVQAVFSTRSHVQGLERARDANIPSYAIRPSDYADRAAFDDALIRHIDEYAPDLVVLAGYMRILTPHFVAHYTGRLINIHPSLLPKYPGLHTHRRALENGDSEHGASVHFVTEELDGGPVILQATVPVFPGDDEALVAARVRHQEHAIYPLVISWFVDNRLVMRDGTAWLDGQRLPPQGYAADE
ncbi:phosphoribosylglycinamide formyltransferase [Erwinia sp. HR93]|uniref:phosphoribosylglycinamide formyltransferase n=1 Tax=Erwinia sp. HR93 TaxID=3094840 RepID=UPI002ADEAE5D|nr:phosphoribosylglycinamide formyltransferase [Erwinia sp. HR93]MEA1065670.1 phosphoribosylglycinamide formyltransferase [Erwinia sp. HR93]